MRKIKTLLKKNYKLLIGFIIGVLVFGSFVYASDTFKSSDVSYDNKTSGLTSTNMQGAIDELNTKADIRNRGRFVDAYTYNASNCVTGEEKSCKQTKCYKTIVICSVGTIIKYKVNDTDIITFHVMKDNGSTITMQQQKNTIYQTAWVSKEDYILIGGGTESEYGEYSNTNRGPLTALSKLEVATAGWTNVNNQTFTIGTTYQKNITAKARMITYNEIRNLGCSSSANSCPKWVYNYTYGNGDNTTISGAAANSGYWTMSNYSSTNVYSILNNGSIYTSSASYDSWAFSARAVVVVSK